MWLYPRYIIERVRHSPMTYILGAKCEDGVVLIADRKITHPDGRVEYQDKLSTFTIQLYWVELALHLCLIILLMMCYAKLRILREQLLYLVQSFSILLRLYIRTLWTIVNT